MAGSFREVAWLGSNFRAREHIVGIVVVSCARAIMCYVQRSSSITAEGCAGSCGTAISGRSARF
eukprot:1527314-Amphidinium_carterae.1